jgi:hypothetical protein
LGRARQTGPTVKVLVYHRSLRSLAGYRGKICIENGHLLGDNKLGRLGMNRSQRRNSFLRLLALGEMFLFCAGAFSPLLADEGLEVKNEKDKTTYTIESGEDKKKDEDKEKAWDMLKNMGILIDGRSGLGKGQNNNR